MICTKCSNEIPDGAKFCPSCGAASSPSPETEKKFYCEKCGLELMNGAKFCSVCGGSGVARENTDAPSVNEISPAAVNLNKPSESDSLVSAMNGVSAAANNAPIPGVPMPANDGVPKPVNGIPTPSSGFSGGASGVAPSPVIPPYVASVSANAQTPVMPMPTASGAAVSTKKSNGGKIALFSILGVLVIAIAAAAIMFSTNRATFLSTFMGKAKYATMVEGASIKNATDKLDIPAIANGIKSASSTYQAMAATMGETANPLMSNNGNSSMTAPMSYIDVGTVTSTDGPDTINADINVAELSRELAELLQSYYGADTISESLTMNVELSDSAKAMLGGEVADINSVLELINGTSVNYTLSAKDDKSAFTVGTQGKMVINAKVLLDGQDVYVSLPFASNKALLISVPVSANNVKIEAKPLELDEKEIERLITECVQIYLDYYKAASIEMESGEINAGGVSVNGKLITAEFKGEKLSGLFTDIAKHIVSDDYLMTQIADYANSCGAETTKSELIEEALEEIEGSVGTADDSDKLVIETVIDRNGNVLGKSVKAIDDKDVLAEFSYAETDKQFGFEISSPDDEVTFKITVDKTDEKSGSCNIKLNAEGEEISFVLNYSDAKKSVFCGKDVYTGNCSLTMTMPESFSDQFGAEAFAAVNGMKLDFGLSVDSDKTMKYSIALDVPSYGSAKLEDVFTVMNDDSVFTKPTDVIDITSMMNTGTPDDATAAQLTEFGEDVMNALKNALPEFIAREFENISGSIVEYPGDTDYPGSTTLSSDISDLLDFIGDDIEDIEKALNGELTYDRTLTTSTELEEMLSEYNTLYLEILAKGNNMTAEEFDEFDDRYWDLYIDLPYFSDDLNSMPGFDDPRLNELAEDLADCYIEYLTISSQMETGTIKDQSAAEQMYNEINNAFDALMEYCDSTGAYDLDGYTDAQLTEVERLLDIVDEKIDAFEDKFLD